jgi:hypothetical protein
MLDPGAGKTKKTYIWAYARGALDAQHGVVYDFCLGRGGQYPVAFLKGTADPPTGSDSDKPKPWQGTLVSDRYVGYDPVLDSNVYPGRQAAACAAHARRKFEELAQAGASNVVQEALEYFARIYHVEGRLGSLAPDERLAMRQALAKPLWDELHKWLKLQRKLVPDGGTTANAIDYNLNHWDALTRNLHDGSVPLDNNHLEQQMRCWAMGRKAWLYCGSELAGKRAAVVMSLVQSAKLNGHDPWEYLRDVLARLPTHPNSRLEELLPHRWLPPSKG